MSGSFVIVGSWVTLPKRRLMCNLFQVVAIVGDEAKLRGGLGSAERTEKLTNCQLLVQMSGSPATLTSSDEPTFPLSVGERLFVHDVSESVRKLTDGFFEAFEWRITHSTDDETIHTLMSDLWDSGLSLGIVGIIQEKAYAARDAKRESICPDCHNRLGSPIHSRKCEMPDSHAWCTTPGTARIVS